MDKQNGIKEYIKLRLRLAQDKIRVAKILFKNSEYRDVISRAYYSVYYAAKAFLLSQGQDPTTHKGKEDAKESIAMAESFLKEIRNLIK